MINVGLDTSGSMGGQGTFEFYLMYIVMILRLTLWNLIHKWIGFKDECKKTWKYSIKGLGGTQPMIDYIVEHHNNCNSVFLTDGWQFRLF
jgi:predicted metal-dependent peptidase